jgi:hypothetical protein
MKAPVASPAKTVDASSIRMTISGLAVRQLAPTEPSLMGIVEGDDPHEGLSQRSVLTLIVSSAHGVLKADQGPIQSCYGQVDEISDRHACLSPSAAAPPSYGRASHGRPTYGRRYRGFVPSSTLLVRCPVTSRELVASGAIQPSCSSQWKSRPMSPRPPSIARYRIHTFADARNEGPDHVISGWYGSKTGPDDLWVLPNPLPVPFTARHRPRRCKPDFRPPRFDSVRARPYMVIVRNRRMMTARMTMVRLPRTGFP